MDFQDIFNGAIHTAAVKQDKICPLNESCLLDCEQNDHTVLLSDAANGL